MSKHFILILAMGLMFFTPFLLADTVYKGTDAQGNTVFSDQPALDSQNSEKIEIQSTQTYNPPPLPFHNQETKNTENAVEETHYQVSIIKPQDKETLPSSTQSFDVTLSIDPQLQKEDKIQLLLNGEPYGSLYDTTNITISPDIRLSRGSYELQARVVSEKDPNKIKGESSAITFYQFRKSILIPR